MLLKFSPKLKQENALKLIRIYEMFSRTVALADFGFYLGLPLYISTRNNVSVT